MQNHVFENESDNNDKEKERDWGEGGSNLRQENGIRFGNDDFNVEDCLYLGNEREEAIGAEEFDNYYTLQEAENYINMWN